MRRPEESVSRHYIRRELPLQKRRPEAVKKHQSRDGNHRLPARKPHAERMRIPWDPQAWHMVPQKALLRFCFHLDSLGNR